MADEVNSLFKLDHATIKAIQNKIGAKADGMIGSETIKKLQEFLNSENSAGLTEDGKFGVNTIKALQKYVGVNADGAFGPLTANAIKSKFTA
jgi:murein L,D-transpeptidase YcbB/YkuD